MSEHRSPTALGAIPLLPAVLPAVLLVLSLPRLALAAPETGPAPEPTSTAAPAAAPAPAPAPWVIQPIEPAPAPAPAPAPVMPTQVRVDMYPHPMAPPSRDELARLKLVSETSRAHGLAVAGWATLGGTYAMSALIGTIAMDTAEGSRRRKLYGGWMTIPVGGPFVAAVYARSSTGKLLTASLGIAQGVGLVVGVLGSVRHRRLKRRMSIAAAPMPEGGGTVAVSGRF